MKNNRDKRLASQRKWKKENPEKFKNSLRKHAEKMKKAAYEKLGNRCNNPGCGWINYDGSRGCEDPRCLQIDHVNGGGNIERKKGVRTIGTYRHVLMDKKGLYQLLCANCNWIKRVSLKEHLGRSTGGL